MEPLIIEVALNEQADKAANPSIPYTVEECITDAMACIEAGASIIHMHARHPFTGSMIAPGIEEYAQIMRAIREFDPEVLCYPTYAGRRVYPPSVDQPAPITTEERFRHISALATDPEVRMRAATIDPGSVNWSRLDPVTGQIGGDRFLVVSHAEVRHLLSICAEHHMYPSFVVHEPGHVRMAATYHHLGLVNGPLHLNICLGDEMLWGVAPSEAAIEFYLGCVPDDIPVIWFAYIYGPSSTRLYRYAIESGGHVRTGLGDNPVAPDGACSTNVDLVRHVTDWAAQAGRPIATPSMTRALLAGRNADRAPAPLVVERRHDQNQDLGQVTP